MCQIKNNFSDVDLDFQSSKSLWSKIDLVLHKS